MPKITGRIKIGELVHDFEVFVEHVSNWKQAAGDWAKKNGLAAAGTTIAFVNAYHHWNDKNGNPQTTKVG